jgi:hypothetical protein
MALRLVGFAVVRVALHWDVRSRGYKFSREEAGPKSLEWWWCVVSIEMGFWPLLFDHFVSPFLSAWPLSPLL